jgi:hypothetical protein
MGTIPVRCDHCAAPYRAFRSGLTFDVVRIELRSELHRTRVTRHTVLGRMHEHKIMLWGMAHGIGRCVPDPDAPNQPATANQSDDDWFAEGTKTMPIPTEDTSFPPCDVPAIVASAPALAPVPAIERKPRKPRARKASIVEAIATEHERATVAPVVAPVEPIADAIPSLPKTSKRKRASVAVAATIPPVSVAAIVVAPVFTRLRHFWCACGKRGSAPIGVASAGCAHRRAA